jgi:hypothetical protein
MIPARPFALLLGTLGLLCAGCGINAGAFTFRDDVTIDENKLRLDGYYYSVDVDPSPPVFTGTTIDPILLWSDGTAAFFGGTGEIVEGRMEEVGPVRFGTLEQAHAEFISTLAALDIPAEEKPNWFYSREQGGGQPDWGAFRIRGDTISIQVFRPVESRLGGHDVMNYDGVILNDTSFVITTPSYPKSGWQKTFRLYPLEEKPSSMNWTQTHPRLQ